MSNGANCVEVVACDGVNLPAGIVQNVNGHPVFFASVDHDVDSAPHRCPRIALCDDRAGVLIQTQDPNDCLCGNRIRL